MIKKIIILVILIICTKTVSAQFTAVRVNALGYATGTINAGVDVAISDKWSVDFSSYWNPIETNYFRSKILSGTIGFRRWRFEPHIGLFWGAHATMTKYRIGNRVVRYNGWMAGLGSSVGYSWMISKRWNFALEGGLGLFYMTDTKWNPQSSPLDDLVLHHYKRFILAPSKLEISFSYLF